MRFHLLGLAHLPTRREIEPCAYTQKIIRLTDMLRAYGHDVFFYGVEGSDVSATKSTIVLPKEILTKVYGDYDWKTAFFKHDPSDEAYTTFSNNAIEAINKEKKLKDVLLCPMGNYQKSIADAVKLAFTVESGVGYEGIFCRHRVFESYAWMHYMYGKVGQGDGYNYDCVIPNAYYQNEFNLCPRKEEYFLYIGRLIPRKGLNVAIEVARKTGARLLIAGQGNPSLFLRAEDKDNIQYIGTVLGKQKRDIMSKAKAVFVPTQYIGPFEGVAVEAQMCGTPVISTDWGVFNETVEQGVSGFRCRTLREFIDATRDVEKLDPKAIRDRAVRLYSVDAVAPMYDRYFHRLNDLFLDGWYQV